MASRSRAPRLFLVVGSTFVLLTAGVLLLVPAAPVRAAATFMVNSAGDQATGDNGVACTPQPGETPGSAPVGECTLRAAIQAANATPGTDAIGFSIPGDGPHTIRPATGLPPITEPVTIDGYSQPGSSPNNPDPEQVDPSTNAVLLIEIDGSALSAGGYGLLIVTSDVIVRGLVINRFEGGTGILIQGTSEGGANRNTIAGNFIGTDTTGTIAPESMTDGVVLVGAAAENIIGGFAAEDRNLISGNDARGVLVQDAPALDNVIRGNLIGTDATGSAALGNGGEGGVVVFEAPGTTIADNTISGNLGPGIWIGGGEATATGTLVRGNYVGASGPSLGAIPNGWAGVELGNRAANTHIGESPGDGGENVIAYNGGPGIALWETAQGGNSIGGNAIFSNAGLGIDLGLDDVTPNDLGDADTPPDADSGPNNLQNFPVLISATSTGGGDQPGDGTTITGTLDSTPNTVFVVDVYYTDVCDDLGHGEALGHLTGDEQTVETDPAGHVYFELFLPGLVFGPGTYYTATAMDNSSNTSEFSACLAHGGGSGPGTPPPATPSPPPATQPPATQPPASTSPQPSRTPDVAQTPPPASPAPGASPTPAPETTSGTVPPGGTLTSDEEGDGATPSDPVETSVTSPNGGTVTIEETSAITEPAPAGYSFLGQQVNITAPPATPEDPLILVFRLDASLFEGLDPGTITVFREGVPLPGCTGATGTASPDPCVSGRVVHADGDLELTALTSAASAWNFGVRVDAGSGASSSPSASGAAPGASSAPSATDADGDGVPDTASSAAAMWNLTLPAGLLVFGSGGMFILVRRSARGRR